MECVPVVRVVVVNFATAEVSTTEPSVVAPSLNVAVPVGVPVPEDVTVAVNVTDCPEIDGLSDDDNAVEVLNLPILLMKVWKNVQLPGHAVWNAPAVCGKLLEEVIPVT